MPPVFSPDLVTAINQLAGGDQKLQDSFQAGLGLSGLGSETVTAGAGFFPFESLGRVNQFIESDQVDLLNRFKAESFLGGQRTPEAQSRLDALNSLQGQAPSSFNSDQDRLRTLFSDARSTNPDVRDSFDRLQGLDPSVVGVDPVLQEVLDIRRAGLDGLTGDELTALREQGSQNINRSLQTGLRNVSVGAGSRGVRGGAAGIGNREVLQDFGEANRGLERDIFLANVAERNQRLNEFQGLGQAIDQVNFQRDQERFGREFNTANSIGQLGLQNEQQRFGNSLAAAQARQGFALQNQNQLFSQNLNAANAANAAQFQRQQGEISDRTNRLVNFGNLQEGLRADQLQRSVFNLNQLAKEKSGQLGLLFGAGSFGASQGAQQQGFEIAKEQLDVLRNQNAPISNFSFLSPALPGADGPGIQAPAPQTGPK